TAGGNTYAGVGGPRRGSGSGCCCLPYPCAGARAGLTASRTMAIASTDALNVLLVDDEPDIHVAVGDALRDVGHRITTAANGAEALDLVTTQLFDVMICDVRLPKIDGLTLFRRTRQESPDTSVILMTAFAAIQ